MQPLLPGTEVAAGNYGVRPGCLLQSRIARDHRLRKSLGTHGIGVGLLAAIAFHPGAEGILVFPLRLDEIEA